MKLIKTILAVIGFSVFAGCYQPKYDDLFDKVALKNVEVGDQSGYFWAEGDTLYLPKAGKGKDYIWKADLELLHREPKVGDYPTIFKAALLWHENAHCVNDQERVWRFRMGRYAQWTNEREGYGAEIIYLLRHGVQFDAKLTKAYINNLTNPLYENMCSVAEATDWVLDMITEYTPESAVPVVAGSGVQTVDFTQFLVEKR